MSLARTLRFSTSSLRMRAPNVAAQRSFSTCPARFVGKESSLHDEGRAEKAEQIKQEQLQKQKDGKGHWHEELSSDSESAVKADRGESHDHSDTNDISKLQETTKDHANKKHG